MSSTPSFGAVNYCVLSVYLATMFGIGLRLSGKQKTTEDYFLAGRRMPWLVVCISMFVSISSATSYMGVPGLAYKENVSLIVGMFMAPLVAPLLIVFFYSFYQKLSITTSYEYIGCRYGRAARFAASGLFILARMGWLGVGRARSA